MKKAIVYLNAALIVAVCVGNYLYLTVGTLLIKGLTSAGFALMGAVNALYAMRGGRRRFPQVMAAGLVLAMLGDIVLGSNFIVGAALFAAGHVCFFAGSCHIRTFSRGDLGACAAFAAASAAVILSPLFSFESPLMQGVCLLYAAIISLMAGKALCNHARMRHRVTLLMAVGSALFYFSDLMLAVNWFAHAGKLAGNLCMATYYPAELILAGAILAFAEQPCGEG